MERLQNPTYFFLTSEIRTLHLRKDTRVPHRPMSPPIHFLQLRVQLLLAPHSHKNGGAKVQQLVPHMRTKVPLWGRVEPQLCECEAHEFLVVVDPRLTINHIIVD